MRVSDWLGAAAGRRLLAGAQNESLKSIRGIEIFEVQS